MYPAEYMAGRKEQKLMKAIINGKIILPNQIIEDMALLFNEKIIGIVDNDSAKAMTDVTEIIDATGKYVSPGLIDIHIHGYLGEEAAEGEKDGIKKIAEGILANGCTSWLPTTMTVAKPQIEKSLKAHVVTAGIKHPNRHVTR